MVRASSFAAFAVILALATTESAADSFDDLRSRINEAYAAGNAEALLELVPDALQLRPGNPTVLYMLAYAHALSGDPVEALTVMEHTVELDLVPLSVPGHSDLFAPMRALPGYGDLQARIADLLNPRGSVKSIQCAGTPDTVPEGVAIAANGTMFVSSIRHGGVMVVADGGESTRWATPGGSTLGLHLNSDGSELWVAVARLPEFVGEADDTPGNTGVVRLDAESGDVLGVYPFEADGEHAFGDFAFLEDGTLVATDSLGGGVYRLDRGTGEWHQLAATEALRSPQGIVEFGDDLIIADWRTGLYRYRRATGRLDRIDDGVGVPYGIDGLYLDGSALLAVQNGIEPHRVSRFELSPNLSTIIAADILLMSHPTFDEPTLGAVSGASFFLIANSHWNRFTSDRSLPEGLDPPCIIEVTLQG